MSTKQKPEERLRAEIEAVSVYLQVARDTQPQTSARTTAKIAAATKLSLVNVRNVMDILTACQDVKRSTDMRGHPTYHWRNKQDRERQALIHLAKWQAHFLEELLHVEGKDEESAATFYHADRTAVFHVDAPTLERLVLESSIRPKVVKILRAKLIPCECDKDNGRPLLGAADTTQRCPEGAIYRVTGSQADTAQVAVLACRSHAATMLDRAEARNQFLLHTPLTPDDLP